MRDIVGEERGVLSREVGVRLCLLVVLEIMSLGDDVDLSLSLGGGFGSIEEDLGEE